MSSAEHKEGGILNRIKSGFRWFAERLKDPINWALLAVTGVALVTHSPLVLPFALLTGFSLFYPKFSWRKNSSHAPAH